VAVRERAKSAGEAHTAVYGVTTDSFEELPAASDLGAAQRYRAEGLHRNGVAEVLAKGQTPCCARQVARSVRFAQLLRSTT